MSKEKLLDSKSVENYIKKVSHVAGINMSQERQKAHIEDAVRLINDANDLSKHVSAMEYIDIGPIVVYRW